MLPLLLDTHANFPLMIEHDFSPPNFFVVNYFSSLPILRGVLAVCVRQFFMLLLAQVYLEDYSQWRIVPLLPEGEELIAPISPLPAVVSIRNIEAGQEYVLRVSLFNTVGRKDVELNFATRTLEGGTVVGVFFMKVESILFMFLASFSQNYMSGGGKKKQRKSTEKILLTTTEKKLSLLNVRQVMKNYWEIRHI